ncbi:NACHT domain-containing protein [Fusarium keratoplasticum]|uniref:NACHT domain-containing protein n=1 Tax=Fusarium keratoplasticum TaxID=1328300 RepID=A0ACC0QDB5_9HYPO|nr:NACHT domain-containing protein [Fusarium keratoplasticum]KAI8650762.1 NACHT domain-containing protein [Fusarium keratoplasticum]
MDVAESLRASGDDLWSAAIRTLGHELTSQIDFAQNSKKKTLDELLAVTDQERKRLVDKSWSFKRKDGEVVFVRDLLAKAAKWVNHFKAVGDTVVQYDPVHAALPWAGVRFLLNVAIGDLDTYNSLLERTVDIAETICRNALVESLLKDSQSQTAKELNRALVKLYASILAYLAKAKSYYEQNSLKRVVKHGILASSDLESAFTAISEAQAHVDRCATSFGLQDQLESHAEMKRMLRDFDAPVNRWDKALHTIADQLHATRRTEILSWISKEPYRQHHMQTRSEVLEGTGKWLLHDPTFLQWKNESASSILWLHGIPGSGKSKLASIVVEDALEAFQQKQAPAPAYFYCSRNTAEPRRSDPSKIVASIARQLSTPETGGPLLDAAIEVYKRREEDAFASGSLHLDESRSLILKLLEQYQGATMTIVIDALDECNPLTRGDLLGMLEDLLKTSPCLLKIFVSSRTDRDIVYKLDNYPNLHLSSDRNSADIDLFVHSETDRLIDKGSLLRLSMRKEEIRDKIIHELTSKAQGMFRWASLQLQALCQQTTDAAILERLGRLPRTLAELYQEILAKIENLDADADRQFAQSALSWLLCAQEQLRSDVFLAAVSITKNGSAPTISRDQLLQLCCNLVIFDSAVDAFRFSHLSVREFLENQKTYQPASANALVAEACLCNLDRMAPEASPKSPLLKYSCLFWAEHACAAAQERQTRLNEVLLKFLSAEQYSSCFYRWHRMAEEYLSNRRVHWVAALKLQATMSYVPRVLLVICAYDLSGVLSPERWRELAQERPSNKDGLTHEEVAVSYGSGYILQWLLSNGIPFEVNEEVLKGAAKNEKSGKEILALLLDKRGDEIQITEGVVKAAAGNYQSGKEILALLLDKRGDEIQITEGVVKAAAGNYQSGEEILALLLDNRGDEIQITEGVVKAVARNYRSSEEILALLLNKRGAEI